MQYNSFLCLKHVCPKQRAVAPPLINLNSFPKLHTPQITLFRSTQRLPPLPTHKLSSLLLSSGRLWNIGQSSVILRLLLLLAVIAVGRRRGVSSIQRSGSIGSSVGRRSSGWASGRELALCTDDVAILVEDDGDGNQQNGDTTKQCRCVLDTQAIEHVRREEGEPCTAQGSEECVAGDSRSSAAKTVC
jgi:hypothetical protein